MLVLGSELFFAIDLGFFGCLTTCSLLFPLLFAAALSAASASAAVGCDCPAGTRYLETPE